MLEREAPFLAAVSLLGIAVLTLFPFTFTHFGRLLHFPHHFRGVEDTGLVEPLANVLLFVPLAVTLAALVRSRGWGWRSTSAAVTAACLLVSLGVEVLQVMLPSRTTAVKDLLMNGLGAPVGLLLFRGWRAAVTPDDPLRTARAWNRIAFGFAALVLALTVYLGDAARFWSLDVWDPEYPLVLGNEARGRYAWDGWVADLFIADRVLTEAELFDLFDGTPPVDTVPEGLLAWYPLAGDAELRDAAGRLPALSWADGVPAPAADPGAPGADVSAEHWLTTEQPVRAASDRIRETSAFTVGATVTTEYAGQSGPARIVSISRSQHRESLMLAQQDEDLLVRVRTPMTGPRGSKVEFVLPGLFAYAAPHRIVVTYGGRLIRVYVDGAHNAWSAELTPEAAVVLAASRLTGRIGLTLGPDATEPYRRAYYGLVFLPLGLMLGVAAILHGGPLRRRLALPVGAILAASLLVQGALAATTGGVPGADGLLLGLGLASAAALAPGAVTAAASLRRPASAPFEVPSRRMV